MSESKSLLLAAFLSALTIIMWQFFFHAPAKKNHINKTHHVKQESEYPVEISNTRIQSRAEILSQDTNRVKILTDNLHGSISLKGAKFDDITLVKYKVDNNPDSDEVVLFSPTKTQESYFADFGWVPAAKDNDNIKLKLPNSNTIWTVDNTELTNKNEVTLRWDNNEGLLFRINIKVDDKYLFHVHQYVTNNTNHPVEMVPYGRLNRSKNGDDPFSLIFHEGPIGTFDDHFEELSYSKLKKQTVSYTFDKGWFGFSDKYWFASVVPLRDQGIKAQMKYKNNKYQLDFIHQKLIVAPNTTVDTLSYLFTGAKNINILDDYSKSLNIKLFDRVVDFGILYFITKPMFLLVQFINSLIGNFGLSILVLTIMVRIILLPISARATISMLKMRQIKPALKRIKALHTGDKVKMNQAVMALFKKNGITPMAGLLPSIMQIPIFFSLYKVLSITIQMRQAPFYGWIQDLSVRDPTNIFTLFGLLNWSPPQLLCIGVLPIMLCITMLIQQKMSSPYQSYDSTQADIIKMMPYIFLFLFAGFPAGLVLYWIWNNLLSIVQQLIITKIKFSNK